MIVFPVNIDAEMVVNNSVYEVEVVTNNVVINADVTTAIITFGNIPEYDGPYEFTPSDDEQIIPILDKLATADIVINPIPSNYGKIGWNGAYLTVS